MWIRTFASALMLLYGTGSASAFSQEISLSLDDVIRALLQTKFEKVFPECTGHDPCFLKKNLGGLVYDYKAAADDLLAGPRTYVVIDSDCGSACAVFADRARQKVRIGLGAVFKFHQSTLLDPGSMSNGPSEWKGIACSIPPQSKEIDTWVRTKTSFLGSMVIKKPRGYPAYGWSDMHYAAARKFWAAWVTPLPLPRPHPVVSKPRHLPVIRIGIPAHGLY